MHKLDNPVLLAQCARIKTMIEKVANDSRYKGDYYASKYHHWQLSPPVPLSEIEKFEEKAGIELPMEYVYYLTQVGGGGACPGTFFSDFKSERRSYDGLDRVSVQLSRIMSEEEWTQEFGRYEEDEEEDDEGDRTEGTISLCAMDLTYEAYLIVAGPLRGRVVYLDWEGDYAPMWPKGSYDFLTWCENFYSELLAGYDINPTWNFMWQEPGNVEALIRAFHNQKDRKYQKEILYSFRKFKSLSEEAYTFLKSIQCPEFQDVVTEITGWFNH